MTNFSINFTNPWLLLLLIPAVALVVYTLFKVNRKFRYTRNRVISFILGLICAFSCTFMLAGASFSYDKNNDENEVIIVVDTSFSNKDSKKEKDSFVKSVIENCDRTTKLGIVTFGQNQVCAVELTKDLDSAYDSYINSDNVVEDVTNIEDALNYAHSLFKNPKLAKIVLVTDGIETDGDAMKATKSIALSGTKIDVVNFKNSKTKNEVQPIEVVLPDKTVLEGKTTQLSLKVQSSVKTDVLVTLYDNGKEVANEFIGVKRGINEVFFNHTFENTGLHELKFKVKGTDDDSDLNNVMYSFINIKLVDKVLILERMDEGQKIYNILKDTKKVTIKNINEAPKSLDALREFDEVILANVANRDMPEGFDKILYDYVNKIGGSLLTVGGTRKENGKNVANMYNREDMQGTLYQDMLPVIAEDYRPPVAVILVIDVSGSMSDQPDGWDKNLMEVAKESAKAGLKALDPRDFVGVVVFGDNATTIIPPTPVSKRHEVETAIDRITFRYEGTVYSNALEKAGMLLKSVQNVNKKHIVLISDGEPSSGDNNYLEKTRANYESGVTTSTISYTFRGSALEEVAIQGHGRNYAAMYGQDLIDAMHEDLTAPEIKEYEFKDFRPEIGDSSEIFEGVKADEIPILKGFFGTKLKKDAKAFMIGEYGEPIYAEWKYGKGKVGSFMCDLNGEFSSEFIKDEFGQRIVKNINQNLFPKEPVKREKVELDTKIDNTEVKTNIYSQVSEGEYIKIIVSKLNSDKRSKDLLFEETIEDFNGNHTVNYSLIESGVYEIEVQKLNENGEIVAKNTDYQEFSYSQEYNPFLNDIDNTDFLMSLTKTANGNVIQTPEEVFEDLLKVFHKEFDPRYILAITVLLALLIDVAVRKFKFKWIHEIIREKKKKQQK